MQRPGCSIDKYVLSCPDNSKLFSQSAQMHFQNHSELSLEYMTDIPQAKRYERYKPLGCWIVEMHIMASLY